MKIKKVRVNGFDKIFEGYYNSIKENRTGFGPKLFDFLSHCMVGIELEEITTIELFYLKKFSSDVKILDKSYSNFVSKENQFDIHQKIDGLLTLHDEILNDDDIDSNKTYISNILPIGCEKFHVCLIFKGSLITNITGAFLANIFKDKKTNKFPEVYMGNLAMENIIAELFYSSFYTFMSNEITQLDVITEFMTTKKFYKYAEDYCNIAHVNTPLGEIVFFGNTNEHLQYQINQIKKSQETFPWVYEDQVYLTFVMRTTFSTFMDIFLSTNYVIDHQNLKLVFINEGFSVGEDVAKKYYARISNSIDYLISYKKELNEKTEIDLNKFNFIFNGSPIIYSVQIPLNKIEDFKDRLPCTDEGNIIKNTIKNTVSIIHSLL